MTTRTVGPAAGIGWLKQALQLARRNPKAIFGGAALFLLAALAVMVPMLLVQMLVQTSAGASGVGGILLSFLTSAAVVALLGALLAGYLRLVDAAAEGATVGATQLFAALRDKSGSMRAAGLMLVMMVLQYALLAGLLAVFAPGLASAYLELLQTGAAGAIQQPEAASAMMADVWAMMGIMVLVTLFFYAVQAVALGQVALGGGGVFSSLADGAVGAARNLLPLLVLVLVAMAGMLLIGVLVALLVGVLALLAQWAGTWLQITLVVLAVPVYLGFMVVLYGVSLTVMYFMWRDICDGRPASEFHADALTA